MEIDTVTLDDYVANGDQASDGYKNDVDVVIIGAGLSGLSAGKLLRDRGKSVVVLESEFGGVDLGGEFVAPPFNRVSRLCREFDISLIDMNESIDILKILGKRNLVENNILPAESLFDQLDLNNTFKTIDNMAQQVPLKAPWSAPDAKKWDRQNCEDLMNSLCYSEFSKTILRMIIKMYYGVEPYEMSQLFFLLCVHTQHAISPLITPSSGHPEKQIVGGSQNLCEKMAEYLDGSVICSKPVASVDQSGDKIKVTAADGEIFTCSHVINALPITNQKDIHYIPKFPVERCQFITNIPRGLAIKTVLFYDRPFWLDKGFSGKLIDDKGPAVSSFDTTRTTPSISGFIVGDDARHYSELTPDERRSALAEQYSNAFQCEHMNQPIGFMEVNWAKEKYSPGGYNTVLPPGFLTKYGSFLRKPHGAMYFAGSETATEWMCTMEGAIQSGERAAREVLNSDGVNEEIYQDEPAPPPRAVTVDTLPIVEFQRSLPGSSLPRPFLVFILMSWMLGGIVWCFVKRFLPFVSSDSNDTSSASPRQLSSTIDRSKNEKK
ncbi:amine oxidase [flavin-containing] B-like isoform X2 [Tubulanus polymorphus]|uniref:amine oxidase [flavin-containing] B-like isoform X2 n=1 Tax=Tubulanus polymorphus TaxID=672921 RepID=UPI003DA6A847